MKRILSLLGVIALFLIVFNSCKKDSAMIDDNNNVIAPPDSNFLRRTLLIDSTATTQDTTETLSYYYDNSQRVITITDSSYNTTLGIFQQRDITNYFYLGTDTLPYKSVRIHVDANFHDTTNLFYFYDAAGKRTRDSIIENSGDLNFYEIRYMQRTYQNTATNIYGYSRDTTIYASNGNYPLASVDFDTATLDGNGLIASNIRRSIYSTGGMQTFITNTTLQNIFYRLNIRNCFDVFPGYYARYANYGTSNNPSHITETYFGIATTIFQSDIIYTYNNNGFVHQTTPTDGAYPGTYNKTIFYYGFP